MSRKREPFYEPSTVGHGKPLGMGELDKVCDAWLLKHEPGTREYREQNRKRIERSRKAGRSARG